MVPTSDGFGLTVCCVADLADGVMLCELLEQLGGKLPRQPRKGATMRVVKLENMSLAFQVIITFTTITNTLSSTLLHHLHY